MSEDRDAAHEFLCLLQKATHDAFGTMQDRGRGLHGYERSFAFERGKVLFALGGNRHTAFLSIPGDGCSLVPDWPELVGLLRDRLSARLTRLDCASDDLEGLHPVNEMVERYRLGEFNAGGRNPSCKQMGNWLFSDGTGRTLYVGERRNGKLYRAYEKGKQLGDAASNWVRHEVQFSNRDRVIPWEAVLEPGRYLAGAYPALRWVAEDASRIATLRRTDAISYKRLVHHASVAYGPLLNVMRDREGSDEAVLRKLTRPGAPRRLALTQRLRSFEEPEE
ncbi:MAG: replication initiation factor domain-containing protein [Burkholderiales bacterium]